MQLRFQKWDMAVILGILALAAAVFLCFLPREQAAYAEIWQNGSLVRRVSLSDAQEFTVTGLYTNTVTVQNGKVAITASDCPGGDCVHSGWTDSRSLVCLPNGVEVRVVGSGGVDIAVR